MCDNTSLGLKGRLAFVVGHTEQQSGAMGVSPLDCSEFDYNSEIAELAAAHADSCGHVVEIIHRDKPGFQGIKKAYRKVSAWEPDAAIELHFNAFNTQVKGTETLYADDEDPSGLYERDFATIVQRNMVELFDRDARTDRGIKRRPRTTRERGWYNVNQTTEFPSILVEPFFGDNSQDAALAVAHKQSYAMCLIDAFDEWLNFAGARATFL